MLRNNNPKKKRVNNLQDQMKIKKFNPIELKAWNSIYPDINYHVKKVNSKKIFDGKIQEDPKPKAPPKKEFDIKKEQKYKPYKKVKPKNPNIFKS